MMSDKLRAAAQAALSAMSVVRVFVTSEEKIKHPEGTDWYDNICINLDENIVNNIKEMNALEAALAEPAIKKTLTVAEQEPVACIKTNGELMWLKKPSTIYSKPRPLYTAPPRREAQERIHPEIKKMYEDYFDKCFRESSAQQRPWVGLTDDEITKLHHKIKTQLMGTYKTEDIYRAIEAKLREKNT
jgi:hypothetical protein